MAAINTKQYTVKEVARKLGISETIICRYCRTGDCPSDTFQFPGTAKIFYVLSEASVDWLRRNVTPRRRTARA